MAERVVWSFLPPLAQRPATQAALDAGRPWLLCPSPTEDGDLAGARSRERLGRGPKAKDARPESGVNLQ